MPQEVTDATSDRTEPVDRPPLPEQRSGPSTAPPPVEHTDDAGTVGTPVHATSSERGDPTQPADPPESISHPAPATGPPEEPTLRTSRRHRRWSRLVVALLVLALLAACAAAVYLYRTSQAWQERSEQYLAAGQQVGNELATTRAELSGARAEIEAVQAQLATAQERIVQLADEKAQLGDDREAQRQTADYQERVSDAAGRVALALDQCVQGQNQLIGYLEAQAEAASAGRPAPYDAAELERYGTDVQALCQAATDANTGLQRELAG